MQGGHIRQATTDDAAALLALINRAFAGSVVILRTARRSRLRRHAVGGSRSEELPPFYRSLGYVETGRSEPVDDAGASKPYHFILMEKRLP